MAHPVYVLLPDGVEWSEVPGTTAQRPAQVRWYLRQAMPTAKVQVAVLVSGDEHEAAERIAQVARTAEQLGGIAIDASTQDVIDPAAAQRV
jgi:hypothetical protein